MEDVEKVLKALQICIPETDKDGLLGCGDCPYNDVCNANDVVGLTLPLILDIRELLKEYELLKDQNARLIRQKKDLTQQVTRLKEQQPKKGHWIFNGDRAYEAWGHDCSECGKHFTTAIGTYGKYCWNCGAEMEQPKDGEQE